LEFFLPGLHDIDKSALERSHTINGFAQRDAPMRIRNELKATGTEMAASRSVNLKQG